ncbi:MAG: metallophosphatase family protein [Leptonema sp. (in: Bacteria)]|nr:metallophosphatase family protein [Leptonema sp. (in: bacteria)]
MVKFGSRTLFVGDIHSDFESFEFLCEFMLNEVRDIYRIVQIGDFGFWPNQNDWLWYPKSRLSVPDKYIDGNHEDHSVLQKQELLKPTKLTEKFDAYYIYRGYADDLFVYCGGATSHDRSLRTEGIDWFKQENISEQDLRRAIDASRGKQIQVIVAHDTVREAFRLIKEPQWVFADQNRELLEQLFYSVQPKLYVHGHYHFFRDYEYMGCRFLCLKNPDAFKNEISQLKNQKSPSGYSNEQRAFILSMAKQCCAVIDDNANVVQF